MLRKSWGNGEIIPFKSHLLGNATEKNCNYREIYILYRTNGEFEFEWGFYTQSASEAIFRARTYNRLTYSASYSSFFVPINMLKFPSQHPKSLMI